MINKVSVTYPKSACSMNNLINCKKKNVFFIATILRPRWNDTED